MNEALRRNVLRLYGRGRADGHAWAKDLFTLGGGWLLERMVMGNSNKETVAEKMVRNTFEMRVMISVFSCFLALSLIIFGYLLTQNELEFRKGITPVDSEITMNFQAYEFALKNTAPGVILIICGTVIVVAFINKQFRIKTQLAIKEEGIPGFTEVEG